MLVLLLILAVVVAGLSLRYVYQQADDEPGTNTTTVSSTPPTSAGDGPGSSTSTSDTVTSTSTTASGGGGGSGTLLEPVDVAASSSLPSEGGNSYGASNLIDGDITTAWSEGAEGPGGGEWIGVEFDPPVTLTALEIANGYQKDRRRFEGNPRVLELRLEYTDGTVQEVRLYDDQGWQFITPEPVVTTSLRLTIVSVYPGDTWDDTSLSELRLFGRE